MKVRAVSTVIIIASFSVIIYLGHVPLMLMILAIQVSIYIINSAESPGSLLPFFMPNGKGLNLSWSCCVQGAMVRELFKLAERSQQQQTKPAGQGRLQQWYFFMVAAFWMYFRQAHLWLDTALLEH